MTSASRHPRSIRRKVAAYEKAHRSKEARVRPDAISVEEVFDDFVRDFGGQKIADRIGRGAKLPPNADYLFPTQNVIAELKTLDGVFSGREALRSFAQVLVDAGHPLNNLEDLIFGRSDLPPRARLMLRTRLRRGLEKRLSTARKQLRQSKLMFGNAQTKTLILIAMNQMPLFGHSTMLSHLASLMADNYADEHTDGIVYLNPNTPTMVSDGGMDFVGWFPFYRDDDVNKELGEFVDLLGNRWLNFYGDKIGETHPILELETIDEMLFVLDGRTH